MGDQVIAATVLPQGDWLMLPSAGALDVVLDVCGRCSQRQLSAVRCARCVRLGVCGCGGRQLEWCGGDPS
jgi:hypothetical protein